MDMEHLARCKGQLLEAQMRAAAAEARIAELDQVLANVRAAALDEAADVLVDVNHPDAVRYVSASDWLRAMADDYRRAGESRPRVITLCGSTRFKDEINAANARLTLAGNLVISLGLFGHTDLPDYDWSTDGTNTKRMLDDLHKRKIDLADEVYVVDVGGYVGESTRSEIDYAEAHGKPVRYLTGDTSGEATGDV